MSFNYETSFFCSNRKRCFLFLILINCFIALIYFTTDFYDEKKNIFSTRSQSLIFLDSISPVKNLEKILNNEYDRNDLNEFYRLVHEEFQLGLRCSRKSLPSNATGNRTKIGRQTKLRRFRTQFYSFLLNQSTICANETIDLLIIIISKSENYKTRDAIRRTWGSGKNLGNYSSIQIRFLFLLDFDEKLQNQIRLENNIFDDIIQVELPQQYTLVTHRVLALLEWSFRYCRTAKFIFKTDDDIFVNMFLLLKFVSPLIEQMKFQNNSFRISQMTMFGYKHYHPGVFRQANDPVGARYVITIDEFPCSHYPDFLSGFGYLIPRKARDALVYAAYHDPETPFRISDVYLTGILPDYLSLSRSPMSDYTIRYQGSCDNFFSDSKAFTCAAGLHHGESGDVFALFNRYWQEIRRKF